MNKLDQIKGAIYGLLVGDAVGVPYEFNLPNQLPEYSKIDIITPNDFAKTYPNIPFGTWSDDGAQALCLLASLLYKKRFNTEDLMHRICNWYQYGYMAVDGHVFDVGIQTATAIRKYLAGIPLTQVANDDELANGNGALMRVLPLAIWHQGTDEQLIQDAYAQSHITHAHLRSKVCCALYCLWARSILNGLDVDAGWDCAVAILREYYQDKPEDLEQLEFYIRPDDVGTHTGSGYVVDCLKSAKFALQQTTYQDVIKTAISLGRDTDTTACVAGGIAGWYFGFEALPTDWVKQLRDRNIVDDLLGGFVFTKA